MSQPPLAANTLLPERDRALWNLATYLKSQLNQEYESIRDQLPNPVEGPDAVVRGIADYNCWTYNSEDFPLLSIYRLNSTGQYLERCRAIAAYYLPSMAFHHESPGILRWVETRIGRALNNYSIFFPGPDDQRFANVLQGNFSTDYGIGVDSAGSAAFPFFRLSFDFEEIGV